MSAHNPPVISRLRPQSPLRNSRIVSAIPLYSKVSLLSPTCCKHKPASVLRKCSPKQAKNPFLSRLLKIICLNLSVECYGPQLNVFQSLSTSHREIPKLCLACITSYNTTYAGRRSERPPITLRNHMICW